jgi:hypothetical protein
MYKTLGDILVKLLDHVPGLFYTFAAVSGMSWLIALILHWGDGGPHLGWASAFFIPFWCLSILACCVWIGVIGAHIEKNKYEYIQLVNNWMANLERKALPPAHEADLMAQSLKEVEAALTDSKYARKAK